MFILTKIVYLTDGFYDKDVQTKKQEYSKTKKIHKWRSERYTKQRIGDL